jgi:hypothetical protein
MKKEVKKIDFSNMPVLSSLGHLAYGDLAFTAWRKIKIKKNVTNQNEEK